MTYYSQRNTKVLEKSSRSRIARQTKAILEDFLGDSLSQSIVLDIGCSGGIITNHLAGFCKKIVGIDTDKNAIHFAKKHFRKKNLSFLVMNGEDLRFKNNSFDVVLAIQIYNSVENAEKLFSEIQRVLKPGGICLLSATSKYSPYQPFATGKELSFWGLKKLVTNFKIYPYTPKILKNAESIQFTQLSKFSWLLKPIPLTVLKFLEPLSPNFIWILEKPVFSRNQK